MPLPDIPLGAWVEDQQKRFRETTDPYFSAFEFGQAAKEATEDIPSDWPLPGGQDQWEQAQQDRIEQEARLQQQRDEEAQRQRAAEIEAQLRAEQAAAEQQAVAQAQAVGIPTPEGFAESLQTMASRDDASTSGAFDQLSTVPTMPGPFKPDRNIVPVDQETGMPEQAELPPSYPYRINPEKDVRDNMAMKSPLDQFGDYASGLMGQFFGPTESNPPPTPEPAAPETPPDNTSSAIWPDIGGAVRSVGSAVDTAIRGVRDYAGELVTRQPSSEADRTWIEGTGMDPDALSPGGVLGIPEQYGIGRIAREADEKATLEREAVTSPSSREQILGTVDPDWEQANPEKATRLEELRASEENLVMGASGGLGTGAGGGMLHDAADAIKQLIRTGMADDAILALERNLAERADVPLSAVRKLTRDVAPTLARAADDISTQKPADIVGPRGERLISAATVDTDPRPGYIRLYRGQENVPLPEGATSHASGNWFTDTAEEAQWYVDNAVEGPGHILYVDVPTEVAAATKLKGRDTNEWRLPDEWTNRAKPVPTPEEHIPGIGAYDELGEAGTSRLRESRAAYEATDAARPMTREEIATQAGRMNPLEESEAILARERGQPAAQIESVRTGAAGGFSAVEHAQQEIRSAENAVADLRRQYGTNALSPEQTEEVAAAMLRVDQLTERAKTLESGVGRMAEASHRGAGELGRGLQQLRSPITGKRASEQLDRIHALFDTLGDAGEEVANSVKQGKLTPKAREKLENARRRIQNPKNVTDVTEDVADELDRIEEASRGSRARTAKKAESAGEGFGGGSRPRKSGVEDVPREESLAERLGRLKREQGQLEEGFAAPAIRAAKAEEIQTVLAEMREKAVERAEELAATVKRELTPEEAERAINESIGRRTESRIRREERERAQPTKSTLPQSVNTAVQRGIDAGLARYNKELDDLIAAVEKRNATDAKRILDGVEKRNAALADSVVKGAFKRNDEAAAQFYGQVTGRNFAAREREAKLAAQAAEKAKLQEIEQNISFVLDHPEHPGAMDQLLTLGHDMTSLSQQGFERWDDLRKRLFKANISRAGMKIPDADYGAIVSAFRKIDPDDPSTVSAALQQASKSSLWDAGREIQYVNMLSDVATNIRNLAANTTNSFIRLGVRNPIESFLGLLTGTHNTGGSRAAISGFIQGAWEAKDTANKIFWTGVNPRDIQQVIETGNIGRMRREVLTERFGPVGAFMHAVSTRPLEALDVLVGDAMRQSVVAQEVERRANQLAHDKLPMFDGWDKSRIKAHIQDNPWDYPEIVAKADDIRERTLLREDNRISPWMGQLQKQANSPDATLTDKMWATVMNFAMPFSRVPVNFAKQGLDYALFPITDTARLAKAAQHGDARGAIEATSHAAVGAGMLSMSAYLALNDSLTLDGPAEEGDRRIWLETHRPRSWRLPGSDTWVSWENTPWAIPAAAVAGATEAYQQAERRADEKGLPKTEATYRTLIGGAGGVLKGISSNVFLDSVLQNIEMLTGQTPGPTSGASFAANAISRYVPLGGVVPSGMMGFLARAGDAMDRDAGRVQDMSGIGEGIANRLRLRIPEHGLGGLTTGREDLPVRRGAFGEAVQNISEGVKALTPVRVGPGYAGYDESLIRKSGKLEDLGVGLPNAPTELTLNSRSKLPLTISEQRDFQTAWGQHYARILDKIEARGGQYRDTVYERARNRAREAAEKQVLRSIPREERKRRVTELKSRQAHLVR